MRPASIHTLFGIGAVAVSISASTALGSETGDGPSLFTGDLGNIIWSLITFVVVLVVLGKFAWGPVLAALQKREDFIRSSLEQAKKEREDAEARFKEYEQKLATAKEEATAIVEEGRRDAEVVKRKIEQDAKESADAMVARAKREIGIATDTAIKELYDVTGKLATDVASRIIKKELSAQDHERLIADSIREFGAAGGNGHGER